MSTLRLKLVLSVGSVSTLLCALVFGVQTAADREVIPMYLEVVMDEETLMVYENPAFAVRIVNPNDYEVTLRGFNMGYVEPQIHLLLDSGETRRFHSGGTDSALTSGTVTVPPRGSLSFHRFLADYVGWPRWPSEPGVYRLVGRSTFSTAARGGDVERRKLEWSSPAVEFRVVPGSPEDLEAIGYLRDQLVEYQEANRKGEAPAHGAFRVNLFCEFLERYGETAYAPEIRWELAQLLTDELGNRRIPEEDLTDALDSFEEAVSFCLDQGGAYTEELLVWKMDRGASQVMELAGQYERWELLKRIARELDLKYPDDEAAKLYRRVFVVGRTESAAKARKVYEELAGKHGGSDYVKRAASTLRYLERRERKKADSLKE